MTPVFLSLLFCTALLALAVPVLFLALEVVAALLPTAPRAAAQVHGDRPTAGVLIPAHNEEQGIAVTIAAIQAQLAAGDRIVVVADNCSDHTAAVARAQGAEILVRQDAEHCGKGYALDCGLRHLRGDPPDVVVIVDADATMAPGTLPRLIADAHGRQRPVQAKNLLTPPRGGGASTTVAAFAFLFKNLVRPLGLTRLGGGCLLTGTGMAFPWALIKDATLASSNIVEDMQLGIDLAMAGSAPLFNPDAVVTSDMAPDAVSARTQRTRWEHGHLLTLRSQVGRVLGQALKQRRMDLLMLGLELGVPPLASLVLLWAVLFSVATVLTTMGALPVVVAAGFGLLGLLLLLSILSAWLRFGRELLPLRHILAIPWYVLGKVPIYIAFLLNPQKKWVRTTRQHESQAMKDGVNRP
jgi:cellulose synthase/poly-beta-1,6-N-acetylglucosamine synthase-like glycosyltransferase